MDSQILEQALELAQKRAIADADVVLARNVSLGIEVAKGEVETLEMAESIGLGVRLITQDRRIGFSYTTALDGQPTLERVVEMAWQNAQPIDPDEHNVLPDEQAVSEDDWSKQDFAAIPTERKVEFCRELERKTLEGDPRIRMVERAGYSENRSEFAIANTRGTVRRFTTAYCSCSVSAVAAQEGVDSEMAGEFDVNQKFDGLRPDWVARRCVDLATSALGGKPCETRPMPVLLDNQVVAGFLSVIGGTLMADRVIKGKSMFAKEAGNQIAADNVFLIDQNDLEKGINRAPFDGEGTSARRTVLIEAGILRGFLHNAYTAHKMGVKTTGNAGRTGGFQTVPEVAVTNCYLEPGAQDQAELIDKAGCGLFITDVMGMHTVNPISGDFSVGAAGRLIEEGRLGRPVRGVTIAGNIREFLRNITLIGSDLRFFGAYGAPSVLIAQMAVSGE
ncbi:MAG TPA: TldD/PmbA family protein [Candidatus Bathyarchaeia archaeon]|nr:TldD/PmbA family protein [Candidatus Bathyarchaeia archaeon]